MGISTLVSALLGVLLSACMGEQPETLAPSRATSRPYQIKGQWYYPQAHYELEEEGIASCYGAGDGCHGALTSTGERFDMHALTAAHKTAVLPSVVEVQNLENGKTARLVVNDRGPFHGDRILDVSTRAAQVLGFHHKGMARVRIKTLVPESVRFARTYRPGNHCIEQSVERVLYQAFLAKTKNKSASKRFQHLQALNAVCGNAVSSGSLPQKCSLSLPASWPIYIEILSPTLIGTRAITNHVRQKETLKLEKNRRSTLYPYKILIGPVYNRVYATALIQKAFSYKSKIRFLRSSS